jgi:hypothetical protein
MESHQLSPAKAQGVPGMRSVQDGEEALAKEGCQWRLGLSKDGGRTGRIKYRILVQIQQQVFPIKQFCQ